MKRILILLILIALFDKALSQEYYNLNKSIKTTIKNSLDLTSIENNISIQELNLKTSYGDLIPTLSFSGAWSRNNTFSKGGVVYQNGIPISLGDQTTSRSNFSLGLNSQVTIFNGLANYKSVDLEKENLASLKLNYEKVKYDLVVMTYQRFFDVVKKLKVVEINEDNLKNSIDQLNKIKEYVNVGKKTVSDIYKQDVQVAQDELSLESAKNELNKSKVELLVIMNEDADKSFDVIYDDLYIPLTNEELLKIVEENKNLDKLTASALNLRYDYKVALKSISINETQLSIAKKNLYFPTLTAFGNYNISGYNLDEITNNRVLNFGLSLNYSILQGFKQDVSKQIAEVNIKQKKEDLIKLERDIKSKLKKAIYDLETAYKQIEISDRNILNAKQDKLLSEENFRVGLGTLLDVQVATSRLNNLMIDRINYIYNFMLAQKQIQYLSGELKY